MAEDQTYSQPRHSLYAAVFASMLPTLRDIAREHGYALGVHGSMQRDLDLIACPWIEEASKPQVLVGALMSAVKGQFTWYNKSFEDPTVRPHGRISYAFYFDEKSHENENGPYIDISVMPRLQEVI
jgi:hypothetical protein